MTNYITDKGDLKMSDIQLTYEKKTVFEKCDKEIIDKAFAYAEGYKAYLDAAKTERESVTEAIKMAEANGFKPFEFGMNINHGDKYYIYYFYLMFA